MTRLPALAAAAALLAVLTACTPGTPTPSATPAGAVSGSSAPEDTGTGAVELPTPGFGSGCADLVPASVVTAIEPGAELHEVLASEYAAHPSIPRNASIVQLRGLLCEWSNGEPYSSLTGPSAFRGIQLAVLPDAASGWVDFAASYGLGETSDNVTCGDGFCSVELFADGYWFSAEAYVTPTPATLAAVQAFAAQLRAQAAGFGRAAAPWAPEGGIPISNDCAINAPDSLVAEIYGPGHDLAFNEASGGWSIYAEAWSRTQDWACGWYGDTEQLSVQWLNGGSWLATELGATTGTALPLSGLTGDDSATTTCDGSGCRVDLLVAGNWVIVNAIGAPDDSAAATRLASHLVGVVRG